MINHETFPNQTQRTRGGHVQIQLRAQAQLDMATSTQTHNTQPQTSANSFQIVVPSAPPVFWCCQTVVA